MGPRSKLCHFFCFAIFGVCLPRLAVAQLLVEQWSDSVAEIEQEFPVRYTLRHEIGSGIGYGEGFTRLEMFTPIIEPGGVSLLFADLQMFVDNFGSFGSNAGLGFRCYSAALDRVFGVYGYFDYRDTEHNSFNRGSIGLDTLGNLVDARVNLYLPDTSRKALPASEIPPYFSGYDLITGYERAMIGADAEIGVVCPEVLGTQIRVFCGVYTFDTEDILEATGYRARIETHWTSHVFTEVAFSRDDYFGDKFTVAIGLNAQPESDAPKLPEITSFRRGTRRHITEQAADRMAEPTHRLAMIATRRGEAVAMKTDGDPWQFFHVSSGAAPGGDGTFESPYQTLEAALAEAANGISPEADIVYTPTGGTYDPPGLLVVPDGVGLLSNAPVQSVSTSLGTVQLPGSGASPDLAAAPTISSSVAVGDSATINGFRVVGTAATAAESGTISVDGASGFTIANNQIRSRSDGIRLVNSNGTVSGNQILDPIGAGIVVEGGSTLDVSNNSIQNAGDHGIRIVDGDQVQVTGNTLASIAGNGIQIEGVDFAGTIQDNNISVAASGLSATLSGDFAAQVLNNQFADNADYGLTLTAQTLTNVEIQGNSFTANGLEGINIVVTGDSTSTLGVTENTFAGNNVVAGVEHREFFTILDGQGPLTVDLNGNTSANTVPTGEFNFDFSKTSPLAELDYIVTAENTGTVGSSDGSVPAPSP